MRPRKSPRGTTSKNVTRGPFLIGVFFTGELQYSSEKIQDDSTVRQNIYCRTVPHFENEPRVFYFIAQNFKKS